MLYVRSSPPRMPYRAALAAIILVLLSADIMVALIIQPPSTQDPANFDASFTGATGNQLRYTGIPALASFTVCFWMKHELTADRLFGQTVMSYSTREHINALRILSIGGVSTNGLVFYVNGAYLGYPKFNSKDERWHHACFVWDNYGRNLWSYIDGSLALTASSVPSIPEDSIITEGGCLVVGWAQDSHCGNPVSTASSKAYTGILSQLNIWTRLLTAAEAHDLYRSCDGHNGNAFSWNWFQLESSFNATNITSPTNACQENYASVIFMQHSGKKLAEHAFVSRQVMDLMSCTSICLRHSNCQSFNLIKRPTLYICELNNLHSNKETDFTQMQGADYYYKSKYWNG